MTTPVERDFAIMDILRQCPEAVAYGLIANTLSGNARWELYRAAKEWEAESESDSFRENNVHALLENGYR